MSILNYYNVQKAIYEKLTSSTQLMASISGVFDYVPQDTEFPFILIGNIRANNLSNLAKDGIEHRIQLNIFSREAGKKQIADIMGVVEGLLHKNAINISGQSLLSMELILSTIQVENDGWTYRGVMDLRVLLYNS